LQLGVSYLDEDSFAVEFRVKRPGVRREGTFGVESRVWSSRVSEREGREGGEERRGVKEERRGE
jgi:hypothetical protein